MTAKELIENIKDLNEIGIELKQFNGDFILISNENMNREVVSIVIDVK